MQSVVVQRSTSKLSIWRAKRGFGDPGWEGDDSDETRLRSSDRNGTRPAVE